MPNARTILCVGFASLLIAACSGKGQQQNADQNISIDDEVPTGQLPANADIETLPADESSATPSNQLQNGIDGPDVNDSSANVE